MKITRPDLAALAVCVVAVVGIIVLAALHTPAPEVLPTVALIALSAGVGIATQSVTGTPALPAAVVAAVEAAPAPVVVPEQRAAAETPVATHAPA